jgi:hypothetical protein
MHILSDNPDFAGLFATLNPDEQPSATAIVDDYEAEQEALLSYGTATEGTDDGEGQTVSEEGVADDISQLQNTVKNASKGVTDGTDGGYRRYFSVCFSGSLVRFLQSNG